MFSATAFVLWLLARLPSVDEVATETWYCFAKARQGLSLLQDGLSFALDWWLR